MKKDKKKKVVLGIVIVIAVAAFSMRALYIKSNITKLTFHQESFYGVSIDGAGLRKTEDKSKVSKIANYLESLTYLKKDKREKHNESSDVLVCFYNKDGSTNSKIDFYGSLVEYNGAQYKVLPRFDYEEFEELIKELRTKE